MCELLSSFSLVTELNCNGDPATIRLSGGNITCATGYFECTTIDSELLIWSVDETIFQAFSTMSVNPIRRELSNGKFIAYLVDRRTAQTSNFTSILRYEVDSNFTGRIVIACSIQGGITCSSKTVLAIGKLYSCPAVHAQQGWLNNWLDSLLCHQSLPNWELNEVVLVYLRPIITVGH